MSVVAAADGRGTVRFLRALRTALDESAAGDPERAALVARLFATLDAEGGRGAGQGARTERRPPACRHVADALARAAASDRIGPTRDERGEAYRAARASPEAVANVARALATLEPSLAWYRRAGRDGDDPAFRDGHANAFVLGDGGLGGATAAVGVSLVAPGVRYPDHRHPPEELYLVLSGGWWRHGDSDWFEPGVGGTVHNVPHIVHAMRAGDAPLLAIWCLLPTEEAARRGRI